MSAPSFFQKPFSGLAESKSNNSSEPSSPNSTTDKEKEEKAQETSDANFVIDYSLRTISDDDSDSIRDNGGLQSRRGSDLVHNGNEGEAKESGNNYGGEGGVGTAIISDDKDMNEDKNINYTNIKDGTDENGEERKVKWSELLVTPTNNALFTPAADISSKENLHGLGLKYSVDRAKVLSRTGRNCALLLHDIATLHDDLANALLKLHPNMLESALSGTPLSAPLGTVVNTDETIETVYNPSPELNSDGTESKSSGNTSFKTPTKTPDPNSNTSSNTKPGNTTIISNNTNFSKEIYTTIKSFSTQTKNLSSLVKSDISRPWIELTSHTTETVPKIYSQYGNVRGKCAQARKDALKMRAKYVSAVKEAEGTVVALKRAKAGKKEGKGGRDGKEGRDARGRIKSGSGSSEDSNVGNASSHTNEPLSNSSVEEEKNEKEDFAWEESLRQFGFKRNLSRQCESVIRALEEIQSAEKQYCDLVEAENAAVADSKDMEMKGLESVQKLEESRILSLLDSLQRLLQIQTSSLSKMTLDLTSNFQHLQPLNTSNAIQNHKELPFTSSTNNFGDIFSPRRRTQSDDLPTINETRSLDLPDHLAETRDLMKSLIGRQSARLFALQGVSSFSEGLVQAMEGFVSGMRGRLEVEGYAGKVEHKNSPLVVVLNQIEGAQLLTAWNSVISSLETLTNHAEIFVSQIKAGSQNINKLLSVAEKELKTLYETEESRWKYLCEAAKGEGKAKGRYKQFVAEVEKARAKVAVAEDEGGGGAGAEEGDESASGESSSGTSTPTRPNIFNQSTKMTPSMNKAMGKMFSILPGGGEDVMVKVLKPEQRLAIAKRNLDEAISKEAKGSESFEVASGVKHQAILSYETAANAAEAKFKMDDQYSWGEMQKSLLCSMDALKNFRDSYEKSIGPSMVEIQKCRETAIVDDVSQWATNVQKEITKIRGSAGESNEQGNGYDVGFSLVIKLEDSNEIKELVNLVINDDGSYDGEGVRNNTEVSESLSNVPSNVFSEEKKPLPPVPPDMVLDKMDKIFSKQMKNVSIEQFYSCGWSEEVPLYRPWLEKKGSFDVSVSDWEHSDDGFENPWSKESFPQRRVIRFKFKRTTHLYIGPPVAGVTQTQYCTKDENDKCILMMTVEMDGIPYSDSFAVEVRWVARRIGEKDLVVDAGVFVRILKSNMFSNKIKSGTLTETKPIHLDLFEAIKVAIASNKEIDGAVEEEEAVEVVIEPEAELTPVAEEKEVEKEGPLALLNDFFSQIINFELDMPKNQQIFIFVSVFILMIILSNRKSVFVSVEEQNSYDDLVAKVDQLSNDVNDIKIMMEKILQRLGEPET